MTAYPRYLRNSAGSVVENFETGADWTVAGGSAAENTTEVKLGAKSLKLTVDAGVTCTATKTVNAALGSLRNSFHLWVYLHTTQATVSEVALTLATQADMAKNFRSLWRNIHPGWNHLVCYSSDFTATGSPAWTDTIVRLRVEVVAESGETPAVTFDGLIGDVKCAPAVVFTFDDATITEYTEAFAYMNAKGVRGTCYAVTGRVGTAGYCSLGQLQEMYAAGWDIANHTADHTSLTTLSQADQQAQFATASAYLTANGMPRGANHVAYPSGSYNATTLAAMTAAGMLTGRTTVYSDAGTVMPLDDPQQVTYVGLSYLHSDAALEDFIDYPMGRGSVRVLLAHGIADVGSEDGGYPYLGRDHFRHLIDYIVATGIAVLTISELYALNLGGLGQPVPVAYRSGYYRPTYYAGSLT